MARRVLVTVSPTLMVIGMRSDLYPLSTFATATLSALVLPYGSQLAAMLYQAYSAGTITNPMATITAITLRVDWRTSRAKIFQMSFIVHLPVRGLCR